MEEPKRRPRLGVFKFASCDGCQLSLLDAEDELLAIAQEVEIAYFLEARTQEIAGPYDVGLVEGSVTTEHDAERIRQIRKQCQYLVTIGACATAGGIQALRNWAPRSATTSGSTSSCAAVRSTRGNSSYCSRRCWWADSRGSLDTASARSASDGAPSAWRWPAASPASGRSRRTAAAMTRAITPIGMLIRKIQRQLA